MWLHLMCMLSSGVGSIKKLGGGAVSRGTFRKKRAPKKFYSKWILFQAIPSEHREQFNKWQDRISQEI
jgi:hypothetical protein